MVLVANLINIIAMSYLTDDFKVFGLVTSTAFITLIDVNQILQFLVLIFTLGYSFYKAKNERIKYKAYEKKEI